MEPWPCMVYVGNHVLEELVRWATSLEVTGRYCVRHKLLAKKVLIWYRWY